MAQALLAWRVKAMKAMHYSGRLEYTLASGDGVSILGGYAACMRGTRAIEARDKGHVSLDAETVTCKRCLRFMKMAEAR